MTTIEEIKRRLVWAMDLTEPTDDWLEQAERRLYAHENMKRKKRIYDVSTLGARIRTAREVMGMTQRQLARRLGVHSLGLSQWEREVRDLPAERVHGLCTCLGVKKAWLLGDSTEGGPPLPERVIRRQFMPDYRHLNAQQKMKHHHRCELERLRGLRAPKATIAEAAEPMSSDGGSS